MCLTAVLEIYFSTPRRFPVEEARMLCPSLAEAREGITGSSTECGGSWASERDWLKERYAAGTGAGERVSFTDTPVPVCTLPGTWNPHFKGVIFIFIFSPNNFTPAQDDGGFWRMY